MIRNYNEFPRDDSSGKSLSNQSVPRTPAEFDYDLWTTVDDKCMVRVKCTGEVSEVERDVFRLLRSEEKRMRREMQTCNVPETEERRVQPLILSLDAVSTAEDKEMTASWLVDPGDIEADFVIHEVINELREKLTPRQREVFDFCIMGSASLRDYARAKGLSYSTIRDVENEIRKKYIKIFG